MISPPSSVAVIGAGIAGLSCAVNLQSPGCAVTVFDKGRRVGGRMSTRETRDGLMFDHGCQYFTANSDEFRSQCQNWLAEGIIAPWNASIATIGPQGVVSKPASTPRFVGVPAMQSVCRHIANTVDVRSSVRIIKIRRSSNGWELFDEAGPVGRFDWLIIAIPPAQAADLLDDDDLSKLLRPIRMSICWTAMLGFASPVGTSFDAAVIEDQKLTWIARNSSKPGRDPSSECWVLQAGPKWSAENKDRPPAGVLADLLDDFQQAVNVELPVVTYSKAHRWMYAIPLDASPEEGLFDEQRNLAFCGDWNAGNRVEAAWISGVQLANRMRDALS